MAQITSYLTHNEKTLCLYNDFIPKPFQIVPSSSSNLAAVKDIEDFMRFSKAWDKKQVSDCPKVMSEAGNRAKEKENTEEIIEPQGTSSICLVTSIHQLYQNVSPTDGSLTPS